MRKIVITLSAVLCTLGVLAVLAVTASAAPAHSASAKLTPVTQRATAAPLGTVPVRFCNLATGGDERCFNLSEDNCHPGTTVLGWNYGNYSNEYVSIDTISNGYSELYFADCINYDTCIYDLSGKLYNGTCDPNNAEDLWKVTYYPDPITPYYTFWNPADKKDALAWNTNGLQMVTWAWDPPNDQWESLG